MDYLLCTTPRVGSTLLSAILREVGGCGDPDEYLNFDHVVRHAPEGSGFDTFEAIEADINGYFGAVKNTYGHDGVFGLKAHLAQMHWALQAGFDLVRNLPDRMVLITRADVLAQAISWVRAAQTGAWNVNQEAAAKPQFDPVAIHDAIDRIHLFHRAWEDLFVQMGMEPIRVSYEGLLADPAASTREVLRHLGVERTDAEILTAIDAARGQLRVQRDSESQVWRARYQERITQQSIERRAELQSLADRASAA